MAYFTITENAFHLDQVLDPTYPIVRTAIAPRLATPGGTGVTQLRRKYPRPLYQFTLSDMQMDKATALTLASFLAYHQGDIPFYWTGGAWGVVDSLAIVAIGDGVRLQFYLPNRRITGALVMSIDGAAQAPISNIDGASGLVTMGSPVAPGSILYATYTCIYKLTVWNESDVLMTESNIYAGLFKQDGIVLREFVP